MVKTRNFLMLACYVWTALGSLGCLGGGEPKTVAGIVTMEDGPYGPSVVFEPLRRPLPEVPFPSDLTFRPSGDTRTGVAWNITGEGPTALERRVRGMLGRLDGFGAYSPITVSFHGPLDLSTVNRESVLVINIEPGHAEEGELAVLDFSEGAFPETMGQRSFWPFDPKADHPDLLLPDDNFADVDGDGVKERVTHYEVATNTLILHPVIPLAPGARYAVLILGDVYGWRTDAAEEDFYGPVRSPFAYKAHAAQADLVKGALDRLSATWGREVTTDELAFGWTFTTAKPAADLLSYRDGIYGEGALAWMADSFPAKIAEIRDTSITFDNDLDRDGVPNDLDDDGEPDDPRDHDYILQAEFVTHFFAGLPIPDLPVSVKYEYVDYFVFGSLDSMDIRTGPSKTVTINPYTGEGEGDTLQVPFLISVPKTVPGRYEPPFRTVIYFHGTSSSRMEILATAENLARQGLAMISFDQVGHGPTLPDLRLALEGGIAGTDDSLFAGILMLVVNELVPDRVEEFEELHWLDIIDKLNEIGFWAELALHGRAEDQNGDGALESSEGFFYGDPFRLCASFWQDLVDFFYLVKVLRNFDPDGIPSALESPQDASKEVLMANMLAGDFNADGTLDVGGPDVHLAVAGVSLGGFHSIMAAALEPEVTTATPIVAGGGLGDIMLRSDHSVASRVFLEALGPVVVGCPDGEGGVWLSFNNDSSGCNPDLVSQKSFAHVENVPPGTLIRVENLETEESASLFVDEKLGFSLAVACDRWDQLEVRVLRANEADSSIPDDANSSPSEDTDSSIPDDADSSIPDDTDSAPSVEGDSSILVLSPYEGTALWRNTPRLRRFFGITQHVTDRCDPISFARHLIRDPLPGHPLTQILFETAVGDETVPVSTGVLVALATGLLGSTEAEWRPILDALVAHGVMEGANYDVDDLMDDNPSESPKIGPIEPLRTGGGESTIRFAHVDGDHEYIGLPKASWDFDWATYTQNQVALFHRLEGEIVVDDVCIEKLDCSVLDDPESLLGL